MARSIRSMRVISSRQRRAKKRTLLRRDGSQCARCRRPFTPDQLILKRIVHRDKGGSSRLDNLHLICHTCNLDGESA